MPDNLRSQQQAWARHIRDPLQPAPAGIDPKRMALYRALCIGGIDGVLSGSFPRLRTALGEDGWQQAVATFYATHACATPLFPALGSEFLAWFVEEKEEEDPPTTLPAWATELAHFEWTQQELLLADAVVPLTTAMPLTADTTLRLSPLARIHGYRWPVDGLLTVEAMPAAPTLLLLQRKKNHTLQITALSAFEYSLLQAIAEQPRSVRRHLQELALESGAAIDAVIEQAPIMLAHLQAEGVVQPVAGATSIDMQGVSP